MGELWLIRHGMTAGNKEKRYIGCRTDVPLLPEEAEKLCALRGKLGKLNTLYISPMRRCLQTAKAIQSGPDCPRFVIIDELKECDFGAFENHNYEELSGDPDYQAFIESGGTLPFPGGETRKAFLLRTTIALEKILEDLHKHRKNSAGIVTHGGVIMSLLSEFCRPEKDFYEWHLEPGGFYHVSYDEKVWESERKIILTKQI